MSFSPYFPFLSFCIGLFVGSFLNVILFRLRSGKGGILFGRSQCPDCETRLRPKDLVPVFSWVFLRGKCRYCLKAISFQYPIIELCTGVLWFLVAMFIPNIWHALFLFFLFSALFALSVYDIRYFELPDEISLPVIFCCILVLPFAWSPTWQDALLGAAIPLLFFGGQIFISQGKWMGGGDLRLGAIMGLVLGYKITIVALFISYLSGSIFGILSLIFQKKTRRSMIPFGPFLSFGILVSVLKGEQILSWYSQLIF